MVKKILSYIIIYSGVKYDPNTFSVSKLHYSETIWTLDNKMCCSCSQTPWEKIKQNKTNPWHFLWVCATYSHSSGCLSFSFCSLFLSAILWLSALEIAFPSAMFVCGIHLCCWSHCSLSPCLFSHRKLRTWVQIHYKCSLKLCPFKALHLKHLWRKHGALGRLWSDTEFDELQIFLISQLFLLENYEIKRKIWLKSPLDAKMSLQVS